MVINIKDAPRGWENDPKYVYIGRKGRGFDGYFGNENVRVGEPGSTLEKYNSDLEKRLLNDPIFKSRVKSLADKVLVCFCKPGPCHGDLLYKASKKLTTYAGIGSRSATEEALSLARHTGSYLASKGWTLRSGAALGMDSAFEAGADVHNGLKEIFTAKSQGCDWKQALEIAESLHPYWAGLSEYAKLLMARNCFQILGADLDSPVVGVLCWTPDGAETKTTRSTGGTGQAIRLAVSRNIPVYNMKNYTQEEWVKIVKNL